MKQSKIISENKNFTAVDIGCFNELNQYSFIHPKNGQTVTGKVFLKELTKSTGTEISFSTLSPNKELGYYHIHNKDEETYIILKGSGYYNNPSVFREAIQKVNQIIDKENAVLKARRTRGSNKNGEEETGDIEPIDSPETEE